MSLCLAIQACAPTSAPPSDSPAVTSQPRLKHVTAAIRGDPPAMSSLAVPNPRGATGLDSIDQLLNAGLALTDNADLLRPELAENVPTIENGSWKVLPDGRMEMTWIIRAGARWHDGTPFTAADAAFTIQVAKDPALPTFGGPKLRFLEGVEAADNRTVVATWKQPFIDADKLFTNGRGALATPLPRHLLERAYAGDKTAFLNVPYWSDEHIGTGPFQLKEFVRGSRVTLTAFDGYVLGRPKIDELEIRFILDSSTLTANLLAGEVELTLSTTLSLDDGAKLRDRWQSGQMVTDLSSGIAFYPQFIDPSPRALADVRFRQALYYALDRQQWVDTFAFGLTTVSHSVLTGLQDPMGIYGQMEAGIPTYPYDPRRSAQLVEEREYSKGQDGIYVDSTGAPIAPVEIRTTAGQDEEARLLFAAVDAWQRLGVPATPNIVPQERNADREYRFTRPGFIVVAGNHGLDSIAPFQTAEMPSAATNWVGGNTSRYSNPDLDKLYDQYFSTMSLQQRIPIVNQILRHYGEQLPYFPIYKRVEVTMVGNRLLNVLPSNDWVTQTWNAYQWDVRS